MKILMASLLFLSLNALAAEDDLMAQFERTVCKTNEKTKEVSCTLDGKKVPSEIDKKKQAQAIDDELDATTTK